VRKRSKRSDKTCETLGQDVLLANENPTEESDTGEKLNAVGRVLSEEDRDPLPRGIRKETDRLPRVMSGAQERELSGKKWRLREVRYDESNAIESAKTTKWRKKDRRRARTGGRHEPP